MNEVAGKSQIFRRAMNYLQHPLLNIHRIDHTIKILRLALRGSRITDRKKKSETPSFFFFPSPRLISQDKLHES